ncbi:hypothetical protein FGB62_187g22 [Gracilaria domingensis]|nr:hypothetical protein FGB62_187g22 [Gracilaria domingensis]
MVKITFISPEVFNVLKYFVLSLTASVAGDALFDAVHAYNMSGKLLRRGYVYPSDVPLRMRVRRGIKYVSLRERWLLVSVIIAVGFEMSLEFSTGAESAWTTRSDTFLMSRQPSSMEQVYQSGQEYIKRMSSILERVEGTCYNIREEWYSPVMFNMTNSSSFFGTRRAAWCLQNYTQKISVTKPLYQSAFQVSDVVQMNLWNASQLRVGGHVENSEESVPLEQVDDVRVGVHEKYSYLAVNFSNDGHVKGSTRALSGNSTHDNPKAYFTANYRTETNLTIECLGFGSYFNKRTGEPWPVINPWIEVCLVPSSDGRMILGMFDDIDGVEKEFQLVMSVALEGVKSFHDLKVLRALPWMVVQNKGRHTYRELGVLAALCFHMITGIATAGFREIEVEFGDKAVTVPTWSIWGMVLLAVGVCMILAAAGLLHGERLKLNVMGNLATANGVAEHWLKKHEHFEEFGDKGRVFLVKKPNESDGWATVAVARG